MAKQKRTGKKDALSNAAAAKKKSNNKKTTDSDAAENAANAIKLQTMKSMDESSQKPTMNGAEKTKKKKTKNEKPKTQATEMNDVKIQVSFSFSCFWMIYDLQGVVIFSWWVEEKVITKLFLELALMNVI